MTEFFCEFVDESKTWFNVYSSLVMLFISIDIESLCPLSKGKQRHCVDTEKFLCRQGISVLTQEILTLCQPFQSN